MRYVSNLIAGLSLFFLAASSVAQVDCEAARCAAQAAIDQNCSCATADNHGRYVRCVAHQIKRLVADGTVPTNCKGKITRCAAKSVCGKPGFTTCQIPTYGTCDPTSALCTTGTSQLADGTCTADTDCLVGTRCKVSSSAERCAARGGTPGVSPTCCSDCVVSPAP